MLVLINNVFPKLPTTRSVQFYQPHFLFVFVFIFINFLINHYHVLKELTCELQYNKLNTRMPDLKKMAIIMRIRSQC